MPKVGLRNMSGESVGELELRSEVFAVAANVPLMHQAVVAEQANARQGTASTLTRDEVSGGGKKPYRQKGTGRARQGSTRAPHWTHGGVVFGPHPRSYVKALPKKMRRGAIKSALSARLVDEAIIVIDEIKLEKISTRTMAGILNSLGAFGKTLVVLDSFNEVIAKSTRNIPGVQLRVAPAVSVRDILDAEKVVMTSGAVEKLQEVFVG
ncbi:MAG: 50S ribosomal protein L4 [Armatimonadetes bacterium]|nr:50S ribosomal protein L4 [Armatimonadota bacterium]